VRELEPMYAGRVNFVVVPAAETAKRRDEIESFGFSDLKHGLVGFTCDRRAVVKIPGHNFGRTEIAEAIEKILPRAP
jgi:hypothetical protein